MAEAIDGTAAPEQIRVKVQTAADELEGIISANKTLHQTFESNEWSGLDDLAQIRKELDETREDLAEIARKVGLTSNVAETKRTNQMVGNKESLGRT